MTNHCEWVSFSISGEIHYSIFVGMPVHIYHITTLPSCCGCLIALIELFGRAALFD